MGTSILYLKAKTISEREMWLKVLKSSKPGFDCEEEIVNHDKYDDLDSQNDDNSEKFQRKLNVLRRCTDKMDNTFLKYSEILEKNKSKIDEELMSDFQKLSKEFNSDIVNIRNGVEDLKYLYVKFHTEFSRLAEYFTEDNLVKNFSGKGRSLNEHALSRNYRSKSCCKYTN
jgi:hypothetical protein